jgi:hypothetical protein
MGKPANSTPPRPPWVPPDAQWDLKDRGFEWMSGSLDAEGRRHGTFRSWTSAGLHTATDYEHGKVHGRNVTFHPDGTIASEADWAAGVIMDSAFYRCATPSPEPFTAAAPNVWSVRYFTRDGKTNYTIRYFTRDGAECGPDGNPLPPRPQAVPDSSRWFPEMDRWVDGEIARGTNAQVGRWRWWSREGVLRREEQRDARGEATMIAEYEPTGEIAKRITRDHDGEQRDYFFEDGSLSSRRRDDASGREIYEYSWRREGSRRILVLAKFSADAKANMLEALRDGDPATRACAVESLTAGDGYDLAGALPCLADRDPLVRVAAAIAIGRTKGPEAPREVITALADGIRNWREIAGRFAELPHIEGHVLAHLALATGSIRTPDARSLAQILCAAFDEVDGRSAITYGQGVLALAFGRGDRPFAKRFIEILDTLARSTKFWELDVNAHEVLHRWNLPGEQTALAALVSKLHASNDPESLVYATIHDRDA